MADHRSEEFVFFALRGTAELMRCCGRTLTPDALAGRDIHVYVHCISTHFNGSFCCCVAV